MTQGVITEEGGDAAYAGSVAAGSKMAPVTPLGVWDDNQYLEASMTNEFVPNMETLDDYLQNAPHVSNMANISRAIQPWETVPNISEGIQYIQSPEPLPNINRGFTPPQPLFMDSSNAGITYIPYRTPFYTDEVFQTLDRQLLSPQSLTELTNVRITDPFFTDHSSVLPDSFSLVQGVFDPSQKAETNFTQDSSGDSFLTNAIDNAAENVSAGSCTSAFNEELPQRDYNCFPHHEFCNCRAERNSAAARAGEGAESKDTAERDFFTEYMNNAKNDLNFGE